MKSLTLVTLVRRAALIAGLAGALFVGSVAVGQPSDVSAAPMTCAQARRMALVWVATGDMYDQLRNPGEANYWYGLALGVVQGSC
jgi:hypothetical protein